MITFALLVLVVSTLASPVTRDLSHDFPKDLTVNKPNFILPNVRGESLKPRIVGGQEAALRQFPYQVGLQIILEVGRVFCGGSVISQEWILTAAHCVDSLAGDITVVLGAHNISNTHESSQEDIVTKQVTIHPRWNKEKSPNDIAVIRLPKPLHFNDYIQPVSLPTRTQLSETFANVNATVSGWGTVSDDQISLSPVLQYVSLPIITNTACNSSYHGEIIASHICASGAGPKSTCFGDSGGPVVVKSNGVTTQIGIVSFGSYRCSLGYPIVFTRVTSFVPWISNITGINVGA